jgi:Trk K+ transport system NAD-binding subunit
VAELLRSAPIYDSLLERLLRAAGRPAEGGEEEKKVILSIPVCVGSALEQRPIREVRLPEDCFLVGIQRGRRELLPRPDRTIYNGDSLTVLTHEGRAAQVKPPLLALGAPASGYE